MWGNKNALLLCHMSAWYIVEMSSKAWEDDSVFLLLQFGLTSLPDRY